MPEVKTQPDITEAVNMRIAFLESHCIFVKVKMEQLNNIDPMSALLVRWARELREAKKELAECLERRLILTARSQEILKDLLPSGDPAVKEERREMLKTFGTGLLERVLNYVPDESREDAITAASQYGEAFSVEGESSHG